MSDSYRYGPDNQGSNQYKYSYGSGSGRGTTPPGGQKPPKKSDDVGEWIGIGLMLFILPFWFCKLIGVVWLIRKLMNMSGSGQNNRYQREARDAAQQARANTAKDIFDQTFGQDFSAPGSGGQPGTAGAPGAGFSAQKQSGQKTADYQYGRQPTGSQAKKQAQPKADPWEVKDPKEKKRSRIHSKLMGSSGKGLIIAGSILAGIFGLGSLALSIEFLETLSYGWFDWEILIPITACLMFMGGGLAMLFSGIGKGRTNERYLNYLAYIGANREVALAPMAASFGVPVSKLCKDLRRMLSKGILPTGYLDLAEGKLFLTEMGYRAPEPKQEQAPPVQEETPQQAAAREDDILREIRQVNDDIPDEVMSAKIDRIEEITRKILNYQKSHPNKEGQLRTFLNYYLPTTLKILRAYAQLDAQGIEGENISAAKERIEGMMDQVVYGFEKQLDKLFQDDAMDITSDVEVLENMLKKDGLSDEGGITMTL